MFNPQPKREKTEKKKKKPIARESKKRRLENYQYSKARKEFLLFNKGCQCGCGSLATEVHHKKGRIGNEQLDNGETIPLLIDERYFLAVCHDCHVKIELNPVWAKSKGYSINRI